MKKFTVLILFVCMLTSACAPVVSPNDTDTTASVETTSAPAPVTVPEELEWEKSEAELISLLSMTVGEIREKHGELEFFQSKDGPGNVSCFAERLAGVQLLFKNRDAREKLSDTLIPDEIIIGEEYEKAVAGVSLGDVGKGIEWSYAEFAPDIVTVLDGKEYSLKAIREKTYETFPLGHPQYSQSEKDVWSEYMCKDPVGNITEIRIAKLKEAETRDTFSVISNAGNINVRQIDLALDSRATNIYKYDFDERYSLFIIDGHDFYPEDPNGTYKIEALMIDAASAETVLRHELCTLPYSVNNVDFRFLHTSDGAQLVAWKNFPSEYHYAYEIKLVDGEFEIAETKEPVKAWSRERIVSADGKYIAFNTRESLVDADGGIDLLMPDGTLCRVIENRPGGEHMRVYVAYGFIGTKMIYKICGWEYIFGYGTYDMETGEKQEWLDGLDLIGVGPERFYTRGSRISEAEWKCGVFAHWPEGYPEKLASSYNRTTINKEYIVEAKPKNYEMDITGCSLEYTPDGWLVVNDDVIRLYNDRFTVLHTAFERCNKNETYRDLILVYENNITVVVPDRPQE